MTRMRVNNIILAQFRAARVYINSLLLLISLLFMVDVFWFRLVDGIRYFPTRPHYKELRVLRICSYETKV